MKTNRFFICISSRSFAFPLQSCIIPRMRFPIGKCVMDFVSDCMYAWLWGRKYYFHQNSMFFGRNYSSSPRIRKWSWILMLIHRNQRSSAPIRCCVLSNKRKYLSFAYVITMFSFATYKLCKKFKRNHRFGIFRIINVYHFISTSLCLSSPQYTPYTLTHTHVRNIVSPSLLF